MDRDAQGRYRRDVAALARLPPMSLASAAALAALRLEEIVASTALAGTPLRATEVAALVERGLARGDRPLVAYLLVADYAAAARYVADAPPVSRRRPFARLEEIVELHRRATRRADDERPGSWRTSRATFPGGAVPPPPWNVPREVEAFVDRHAAGPARDEEPLLWVAAAHHRFARIHPFATANGRVGRLLANLLLRRLGLPPLIVRSRDAATYLAALRRADARDPWPLAALVARCVLAAGTRLAVPLLDTPLVPLRSLAAPADLARLYKAAQRGRLRTLRRSGTLLTTASWLAEYLGSQSARAGRP